MLSACQPRPHGRKRCVFEYIIALIHQDIAQNSRQLLLMEQTALPGRAHLLAPCACLQWQLFCTVACLSHVSEPIWKAWHWGIRYCWLEKIFCRDSADGRGLPNGALRHIVPSLQVPHWVSSCAQSAQFGACALSVLAFGVKGVRYALLQQPRRACLHRIADAGRSAPCPFCEASLTAHSAPPRIACDSHQYQQWRAGEGAWSRGKAAMCLLASIRASTYAAVLTSKAMCLRVQQYSTLRARW